MNLKTNQGTTMVERYQRLIPSESQFVVEVSRFLGRVLDRPSEGEDV